jgi:hypothetical protein
MKTLLLTTALFSLIALAFGCGSAPANNTTVTNKPANVVATTPVTPASTPANTTSNATNSTAKPANVTKAETPNSKMADKTDAAPGKNAKQPAP